MPLNRRLFAVRVVYPTQWPSVEWRIKALTRFYAALGARGASVRTIGDRLRIGSI